MKKLFLLSVVLAATAALAFAQGVPSWVTDEDGVRLYRLEPVASPSPTPEPEPTPTPEPEPTPTPEPSPSPTPEPEPPPQGGILKVGYGAITSGGDGGDKYTVTTLQDSGPGSLRAGAVNRSGPRVVTCASVLSGKIKLASDVKLRLPYLTIDLSACNVTVEQANVSTPALKIVATHDIIIHGVRSAGVWVPTKPGGGLNDAGTLSVDGDGAPTVVPWDPNPNACGPTAAHKRNSCRIILDQNTLSGAADDGPDFWCGVSDLTISRSLIIDSYHPRGTGCKGVYPETHHHARRRITEYANVYAYNGERQPKLNEGVYDFDFINNVIFGWQDYGTFAGKGQGGYGSLWDNDGAQDRHNVIGNVWMPEEDGEQGKLCAADPNLMGRCRLAWDCVWGPTPKNNNEVNLRADRLHYSENIFGPWHGALRSTECVSTPSAQQPIVRPYRLHARSNADMEKVLDEAGVRQRTAREAWVIEKVRAELKKALAR